MILFQYVIQPVRSSYHVVDINVARIAIMMTVNDVKRWWNNIVHVEKINDLYLATNYTTLIT